MNSRAEGTKTTPLGNWEERPGEARDVISCRCHQSALIMCSNAHRVPLAAGQSQLSPGAGGGGGWKAAADPPGSPAQPRHPCPQHPGQMAPQMTESPVQDHLCVAVSLYH